MKINYQLNILICIFTLLASAANAEVVRCKVDLLSKEGQVIRSFVGSEDSANLGVDAAHDGACVKAVEHCNRERLSGAGQNHLFAYCRIRPTGQESVVPTEQIYDEESWKITTLPLQVNNKYSSFEGPLAPNHDLELDQLRRQYFYDEDGEIALNKIDLMARVFAQRRKELEPSVYMFNKVQAIEEFFYDDARASKRGQDAIGKDSEVLFAFDFVVERGNSLVQKIRNKELNQIQIRDEAEKILMVVSLLQTVQKEHIWSSELRMLGNLIRLFYSVPVENDPDVPFASNLIENGRFLTQKELQAKYDSGQDLSLLNPPSSALWTNNEVEKYDAFSPDIYGQNDVFPKEEVPSLYFKRMGVGTIKIKTYWKKQKPGSDEFKKRDVTIRLGMETHTTILTSHLARAVGLPAVPAVYKPRVKLYLEDIGYEQFLSLWRNVHDFEPGSAKGTPITYIESYNQKENYVVLKNVCLEGYPTEKDYRQLGPFRSGRNGFTNRREYRGSLVYTSLIDLNDTGDRQLRADIVRDEETGEWQPLFFFRDTGYSMGPWLLFDNPTTVNGYTDWITERWNYLGPKRVTFYWNHSDFNTNLFENTKYEDAKWMVRRYLRLSSKQIEDIVRSSGFPEAIVQLYTEKIKLRLHNLAEDFELVNDPKLPAFYKEINQLTRDGYREKYRAELHRKFPREINDSGDLEFEIENNQLNTVPLLGPTPTLYQLIVITAHNMLREQLQKQVEISPGRFGINSIVNLGSFDLSFGPKISGSRAITLNRERGKYQKRFLVKDTMTLEIPVGMISNKAVQEGNDSNISLNAPLSFSYSYTFDAYHSHTDLLNAQTSKFFDAIIPGSIYWIRNNLSKGEILHVKHEVLFNIGSFSGQYRDIVKFDVSPLGYKAILLNELYITNPSEDLAEIATTSKFDQTIKSGVDIQAYIKLAAQVSRNSGNKNYTLYRMDKKSLNEPKNARLLDEAYKEFLLENDFSKVNQLIKDGVATSKQVDESWVNWSYKLAFLFWGYFGFDEVRDIELRLNQGSNPSEVLVPLQAQAGKNDIAVTASETLAPDKRSFNLVLLGTNLVSTEQNFTGVFTDPIDPSMGLSAGDYFTKVFNEGTARTIQFEGLSNVNQTEFEEINLVIDVDRAENWVTRNEFKEDWVDFFNRRISPNGNNNYITYKMPEEVSFFSPLTGKMHWQIRKEGFKKLMKGFREIKQSTCPLEVLTLGITTCSDHGDVAGAIKIMEEKIAPNLSYADKKEKLREKTEAILTMVRVLIGSDAEKVGLIRKYVDNDNLWVFTKIENPLEYHVPATIKTSYFAPEVGKYQGHSFLKRFRIQNLILPHIYVSKEVPLTFPGSGLSVKGQGTKGFGLEFFKNLPLLENGLPFKGF